MRMPFIGGLLAGATMEVPDLDGAPAQTFRWTTFPADREKDVVYYRHRVVSEPGHEHDWWVYIAVGHQPTPGELIAAMPKEATL